MKKLLTLMGVPVLDAPCEAEATVRGPQRSHASLSPDPGATERAALCAAQCAALVKANKAFAVGTEDMDVLTFGTPIMVGQLRPRIPPRERTQAHIGSTTVLPCAP